VPLTLRSSIAAATLTLATTGCVDIFGPSDESRFDEARRTWLRFGPLDYQYEVIQSCFCAVPAVGRTVVVVVAGDVIVDAWVRSTGESLPASTWPFLPTVEDLFDLVDRAIRQRADRLDVRYDGRFGYPRLVDVDWDRTTIDEEIRIEAFNLVGLQ
jgi:hypothetical protein